MEIWRDIPKYEGLYQVSNYGRVKSLDRDVVTSNSIRHYKGKIMKASKHAGGRLQVRFCGKLHWIHRLVAEAFIPNPHNYDVVHHIDHNPENNAVENLIWMSHQLHDAKHRGKITYQYTLNNELVKIWESANKAAQELNFNSVHISECCRGDYGHKTYKGYRWSYVPL